MNWESLMTVEAIRFRTLWLAAVVLIGGHMTMAQEPLPTAQPVNVVGTWILSCRNWDGQLDTKTVDLKQNGSDTTGHFKGPYQSGGLQGTVNGRHIMFRTKTRTVLTFRGPVEGDTMQLTYHVRGKEGQCHGYRSSPK
jgi:hypothetical protein